jgi:hypothetical protein
MNNKNIAHIKLPQEFSFLFYSGKSFTLLPVDGGEFLKIYCLLKFMIIHSLRYVRSFKTNRVAYEMKCCCSFTLMGFFVSLINMHEFFVCNSFFSSSSSGFEFSFLSFDFYYYYCFIFFLFECV